MDSRKFASVLGSACVLIGVVSLVPSLVGSAAGLPALKLPMSYGLFLGLFPVNVVNKLALIIVGTLGILAGGDRTDAPARSIRFARGLCIATSAMAIMGLIGPLSTGFGYWPLFGTANVITAIAFAVASGIFGYGAKLPVVRDLRSSITSR